MQIADKGYHPHRLLWCGLPVSTWQIVAASQWLDQTGAFKGDILQAAEDTQPWDVSVKSLTLFPVMLSQMATNVDWTRSLGDAFVNDPNDVINAIRALRLRAQQTMELTNQAAAHQQAHAEPKHEPARHEQDKHANEKHEGEKQEREKHNG